MDTTSETSLPRPPLDDTERLRANYHASYPVTRKLLHSSLVLFSQTCPLIAQDAATVDLYADAFRKVWSDRKRLVEIAKG